MPPDPGNNAVLGRDFCDGLREEERKSWSGWRCVNHSRHMVLPAAVAPGAAQRLRKPWPEMSPCLEAGQGAAGCPALNHTSGKGQDMGAWEKGLFPRGRVITTLTAQGTGSGFCFLFPRLAWCLLVFLASGSHRVPGLRRTGPLLVPQLRQYASPSARGLSLRTEKCPYV